MLLQNLRQVLVKVVQCIVDEVLSLHDLLPDLLSSWVDRPTLLSKSFFELSHW